MNAPVVKWEKQTGKYQSGEWCRVGKVIVGSASYSSARGRDDPHKYAVNCLLPGINQPGTHYVTLDEAKVRLEQMVAAWFSWVAE